MGENRLPFHIFLHILSLHAIALDVTSRKSDISPTFKLLRKSYSFEKFDTYMPLDSSNADPYVSSPFSLPPYESLPPISFPDNTPPYCVYPPPIPGPPSTVPTPTGGYTPPSPLAPTQPTPTPSNPPTNIPSPSFAPPYYAPTPPAASIPNPPPYNNPSPFGSVPTPRFLPPIVFPPPAVPPPPHHAPAMSQWCVAKASVPDPIIEEAMNYACGSGADCDQIQPSGSCFRPDTLFAHASYAFNSYWQRSKLAGGTCDFGGTAILVTIDPSYDGCHFTIA